MRLRERKEDWEAMRRRLVRETEEYLEDGLRHPEKTIRIPAHRAGRGFFPLTFAVAFWRRVLGD